MKEKRLSTISLPVSVNIDDIEEVINRRLDGTLYEDDSMKNNGGDRLTVKVEKNGPVRINLSGQRVDYKIPLKIWVARGFGFSTLKVSGAIILDISTSFRISENWALETRTKVIGHEWQKKPVVHFGALRLPIKFIGNKAFKRSKTMIGDSIDLQLKKRFDLRSLVAEAWHRVQQPIELSSTHDFWVSVVPEALGMTDLLSDGKQIKATVIIQAEANAVIGAKPVPRSSSILPPFSWLEEDNNAFLIKLSTFIPFAEAEKMAMRHLAGETFSSGSQQVRVEDIRLYGRTNEIVVDAWLKGAFNGKISLTGKPVYDIRKNVLEMEELKYEIETRNILMRSANWLFKKEIEKRLKKELRFPLKQNLEQLESILESELEHYEIAPNVYLQGDLHEINIEHTEIEPEGIRVVVASSGKLNLLIKGFLKEN